MRKKSISIILIVVLAFTFSIAGVSYAETKEELQNELNNVQSEKDDVSNRLAEVKKQIDE